MHPAAFNCPLGDKMTIVSKGFTLIELMIVVAIIAILAAIALPAYQDYTIRSQVSEGVTLADGARVAVWDFVSNHGTFPTNNISVGLASPASITGKYVTSVDVTGGVVAAEFGNNANTAISAKLISLSPVMPSGAGSIVWKCSSPTINGRYLPTVCR
jgi:type IV pilus assembly protein PilA